MTDLKNIREKLVERLISGGALDEIVVVALEDYLDTNINEIKRLQERGFENLTEAQRDDLKGCIEVSYALIRVLKDYSVDPYRYSETSSDLNDATLLICRSYQ